MSHFTPNSGDFTGGVKCETHRRRYEFHTFPTFHGCSLEGYVWVCARARADATYLQRIRVKSGKSGKFTTTSCDWDFTSPPIRCEIGCEIGRWSA